MPKELTWASSHYGTYNCRYNQFSDYYEGKHPKPLLPPKLRNSDFGKRFGNFKDNLCRIVCDSVSDRLQLTGITSNSTAAQSYIDSIWRVNRMPLKSGRVHSQALKLGDAFLILWPDASGFPRAFVQDMGSVAVRYDELEQITEATKSWRLPDGRLMLIRYFADRIERYATRQKDLTLPPENIEDYAPYSEDGFDALQENPYSRVPVFHFSNSGSPETFAASELTDVIPIQDQLNKTGFDLMVGQEYLAFPQRYIVGAMAMTNPETGEYTDLESSPDRLWFFGDSNVKLGQFDSADLKQLLDIQDADRLEISRVSRTPAHLFMLNTGDFPSGEALKTAESPLRAKARDRQLSFGNTWEDAMSFACLIGSVDPGELTANWEDTFNYSTDTTPTNPA